MPTACKASLFAAVMCTGLLVCGGEAQDRPPGGGSPGQPFETFDATRFVRPTVIDNAWMPLKPGTRFIYEGTSVEDDGKTVPHRIVVNVTDLKKQIGGIRAVITWDLDFS